MCAHFECVLILSVFSFWAWLFSFWVRSHFECVLILSAFSFWVCFRFECVLLLSVLSFLVCSHFECVLLLSVFSFCVLLQKILSTHILHNFWRPFFSWPIAHKCYFSSFNISNLVQTRFSARNLTQQVQFSSLHPGKGQIPVPGTALEIKGAFHSTKYSGFKFRFQVSREKYEIKQRALLPLFTCFGVVRRLWSWNKRCVTWGWQYHFYRKNLKGVRDYIYGTSLFSWRVQESLSNDEQAVHSSGYAHISRTVALYFRTTH